MMTFSLFILPLEKQGIGQGMEILTQTHESSGPKIKLQCTEGVLQGPSREQKICNNVSQSFRNEPDEYIDLLECLSKMFWRIYRLHS